eukprot:scaffold462_cov195-Pinguiococcus_pyrenoidosus.AAC.73
MERHMHRPKGKGTASFGTDVSDFGADLFPCQLDSTRPNSTQLNSTQLDPTQLDSVRRFHPSHMSNAPNAKPQQFSAAVLLCAEPAISTTALLLHVLPLASGQCGAARMTGKQPHSPANPPHSRRNGVCGGVAAAAAQLRACGANLHLGSGARALLAVHRRLSDVHVHDVSRAGGGVGLPGERGRHGGVGAVVSAAERPKPAGAGPTEGLRHVLLLLRHLPHGHQVRRGGGRGGLGVLRRQAGAEGGRHPVRPRRLHLALALTASGVTCCFASRSLCPCCVFPLAASPAGLVALVVLVAPRVCMDETETADCSAEYDALEIICEYSPVSIFTDGHVLIRRITQHALVIGLIQVILVFATLFPKWQDRVLRCRGGLGVAAAVFLNSTLGVLSLLTFMYLVRWAALHLSVDILNVGLLKDEDALQDIGLGLTVLWNSWFFVLSCFLSKGSEHRARPEELSALFYIVKLCLIVMIAAYFWRGCGHPNIGFVAAQQELTGLMVLLPTFYALGYVFALFLDCITSRLVLGMILTTLVALYALESVGQVEWRNAPGLVLCAFIHIMTKLTGYFGTKELIFKRRSVSSLARAAVQADFATRNGHSSSSSQPIRIEKLRDDSRPGDANELPSALGKRSAASIEPRKVEISALESPLDVQDIRAARKLGVGLALCAAGIAFVLAIFILFTGSLAILQDEFKVFPETIRYSIAKDPSLGDEHLYIDHAKLAGLHLSKGPKGPDEVTRQSSQDRLGYASCGVHYFGLPLDAVDYAMLSEVAYFDRKEDIVDILQFAFAGSSSKQDFAVRFPEDQIFPLKPSKVPRLVEVDFPKLNVSVITVRDWRLPFASWAELS